MSLSRFATHNLKAVLFVTVCLCVIGVGLLSSFPVSILPDVTFPRIIVIAEAGDRPQRMVEVGITRPIEQAVSTIPGVGRIHSKIQRGATETSIDFNWGTDIATTFQTVNAKVNEIRGTLPPDTQVSVERMNPTVFPILGLSLQSDTLSQTELWQLATYTLKARLTRVPGVARVEIQGGRIPEISVDVYPQKLQAFKLAIADVEQAIAQSNLVRSVGKFDHQYQLYQAIVSGETANVNQIKEIVVAQRNGIPIPLKLIADVREGVQDQTTIVTADGRESVLLNIVRQPEANTMAVVEGIKKEMVAAKQLMPSSVKVGTFYDQSVLIGEAVGSVRDAVLIGALLAVVILLLFLGNLRATLVTAVIIPATVLITFLLMRLSGLTLNLMTLGALAVGIGLVIDDAIVVVENIFRHLSNGEEKLNAIRLASTEIAAPMISSTLTTVVVFLPLVLVTGVAGAFFTALAMTLVIALMVSLVLALLVSPSLCVSFLKVKPGQQEHGRLFERVIQFYERVLRVSLKFKWIVPIVAACLIFATVTMGKGLGSGFMPEMDEGAFVLDFWTPPGASLKESDRLLMKIEEMMKETKEINSFSRRMGTELGFAITEPNRGDFAVTLKRNRTRRIDAIMDKLRDKIVSEIPGVDVDFHQVLQDLIGDLAGAPSPVEVKIFGENPTVINPIAESIKAKMEGMKKTFTDVKSSAVETGPELVVHVDAEKAGRLGLTADAVASQANAAMFGDVVTQVVQNDRQIGVRVRFRPEFRGQKRIFERLPIRTPAGFSVPLSTLGTMETVSGSTESNREDQRRMVSVGSQLATGVDLGKAGVAINGILKDIQAPPGVSIVLGGQFKSQADTFRNMSIVLGLAVLLVFGVMLFQFRTFTAPTVILLIMPLSLFGVVLGLTVTKTPLNVSSFMGAIMLVGVVVKNGILLLDQAQKAEEGGVDASEAVIHAGEVRLRPILMTTLTAILGLVPLGLGLGAGAEMQKPLAIAVIGGLTFSTFITLIFAPYLYVAFRTVQGRATRAMG